MERNVVMAMNNLQIAQARDEKRYKHIHSGSYKPNMRQFQIGDFVYLKRANLMSTLQTKYKPDIYKVFEIKDSGVIVLQGQCGGTFSYHGDNLAPCTLPNVNTIIDPTLALVPADLKCEICSSPDDGHCMALCDHCNLGYHSYCIEGGVPALGDHNSVWICPSCTHLGVTTHDVLSKRAKQRLAPKEPLIFLTPEQMDRDREAKSYDKRVVAVERKQADATGKKVTVLVEGVLEYMGRNASRNPKYFTVRFVDGTVDQLTLQQAKRWLVPTTAVATFTSTPTLTYPSPVPNNPSQWAEEYERVTNLKVKVFEDCAWIDSMEAIEEAIEGGEPLGYPLQPADVVQLYHMIDFNQIYTIQDVLSTCTALWPTLSSKTIRHFNTTSALGARELMAPASQLWLRERIVSDMIVVCGDDEVTRYLLPLAAQAATTVVLGILNEQSCAPRISTLFTQWVTQQLTLGHLYIIPVVGRPGSVWVIYTTKPSMILNCTPVSNQSVHTHEFCLPDK
jgi:hypothetical protein